jgi:DNA-binding SARP family transcriptional activator
MSGSVRLILLGAFSLIHRGQRLVVPHSGQRLLAFLGLHPTPVGRARAAAALWPNTYESRALACLRSALWRIQRGGCDLVDASGPHMALAPLVEVDFRETVALAHNLIAEREPLPEETSIVVEELSADLLPDWYEDWVEFERPQLDHLRLHALESLSERLVNAGRLEEAGEAALAGVAIDPLRESAHRAMIRVHIAEGNVALALRNYAAFRKLSREKLGVDPSQRMEKLIRPVTER